MQGKKLILIIDDEPDFTKTMRFFLENSSFRVSTALSGEEGLQKAGQKPDLILLDLNMPDINGHEVCRRLKENGETRHIPVIMLTSQDRTIDKVEALGLGAADYMGKLFPLEEMLARIKAVLRESLLAKSPEAARERNKKVLELRRVIDEKDIRILYQPIVALADKKPIGYEALSRGPKGSFLESPLNLFAMAADADMFFELDEICRNMSVKNACFLSKDQILFLNTDPEVIETAYFKGLGFLKDTSLKHSQISFEITERTCIESFAKLSQRLKEFKSMGFKFSIDDVGTGYSSLRAIAELKPEFIKIDIAFVRSIDTDRIKSELVQAIVAIGRKLESSLIAEGIETENEYRKLLSLGVEYGQGYLFERPTEHPILR